MGCEYQISFPFSKLSDFNLLMGRLGGHVSPYGGENRFEFGVVTAPYATVLLDEKGVYFCNHLSDRDKAGRLFLQIVDHAISYSDSFDAISVTGL